MAHYNILSLLYSGKRTNAKIQWRQDIFLETIYISLSERKYFWLNTDKANLYTILGFFKQEM